MTQKIAVALIHGIGKQDANYAETIIYELKKQFSVFLENKVKKPAAELVVEAVYWAPVIQRAEDKLWGKLKEGGIMSFRSLRRLMIDFAADAIAYQPAPGDKHVYDNIHKNVAKTMKKLATHAGEKAPLCVVAHSLGSIIASNYFWDLQSKNKADLVPEIVRKEMGNTPLEHGKTLSLFYTLGSPMAIWSLRYKNPDFGKPLKVPSPDLHEFYPCLRGEWVNFYDKDDIIGFPLKTLNDEYAKMVTSDNEINVGDIFHSWNPMSHLQYWRDNDVIIPIARSLAQTWEKINL